jgi:hypothetical protein
MATSTVHQSDLPIAAENITAVRFYATAATTADVLLDNVKVYHSDTLTDIDNNDSDAPDSGDNDGSENDGAGDDNGLGEKDPSFDGNGWTEEQKDGKGE